MKPRLEVLILAGGGGTRLWPLSREAYPKPFLPLAGGVSPLRRAVSLADRIAGRGHAWVVTGVSLARRVRLHLGKRSGVRVVVEPAPRNTAAALALGSAIIRRKTGAGWVLCLPADQWVRRPASFRRVIRRIVSRDAEGWLVTFGIPPSYANSGYGYIQVGERISGALCSVRRFVEKPPAARAARYVRTGRWLWNSGMFLWCVETYLKEVDRLLPEVGRAVTALASGDDRRRRHALRHWHSLKPISVDYGILEKARKVAVARCDIGWQDLGSWDAVAEGLRSAPDGSRHMGRYRSLGGGGCLMYAAEHLTVNLGVRGVGLIVTRDAILLFKRSEHQRVREVVELLHRTPSLASFR